MLSDSAMRSSMSIWKKSSERSKCSPMRLVKPARRVQGFFRFQVLRAKATRDRIVDRQQSAYQLATSRYNQVEVDS